MRTKTLLTTAALSVAGLLSASAQVYSVNAVGYVNLTLRPGFNMIANPLIVTAGNTLNNILPDVPVGSLIFTWNAPGQTYDATIPEFVSTASGWFGNKAIAMGQGFWLFNPGAQTTVTFVGDVAQGNLTNDVVAGFNLLSSIVPQSGKVTTDLGMPVVLGDLVYTWDAVGQKYSDTINEYTGNNNWFPSEPTNQVAQAFFLFTTQASKWTRVFNVNL